MDSEAKSGWVELLYFKLSVCLSPLCLSVCPSTLCVCVCVCAPMTEKEKMWQNKTCYFSLEWRVNPSLLYFPKC